MRGQQRSFGMLMLMVLLSLAIFFVSELRFDSDLPANIALIHVQGAPQHSHPYLSPLCRRRHFVDNSHPETSHETRHF